MNRVSDFGHSIFILTCYYSVIYVFGIPFVYSLAKKKHKTMKKKSNIFVYGHRSFDDCRSADAN